MVTCQSSELGWEVTVELPADFLSLGRGSVKYIFVLFITNFSYAIGWLAEGLGIPNGF